MRKRQAGSGPGALSPIQLKRNARRRAIGIGVVLNVFFSGVRIGVVGLGAIWVMPKIAFPQELSPKVPSAQHAPYALRFGVPKQTAENQVSVALELAHEGESEAINIWAQIPLPDAPWRFQKAESPKGSRFELSTRLQREEQTTSDGRKLQTTVLYLKISGRKGTIPAGVLAQLIFLQVTAGSSPPIALVIRNVEIERVAIHAEEEPPPLEPPSANPPANPAPTCFFFAH